MLMRSKNSGTILSNKISAQLQTAEQQSGIGAAVPKTLVTLLTKPMCESTLSLSRNAFVVTRMLTNLNAFQIALLTTQ